MKPLCVAFTGYAKSGRNLLWRILDMILTHHGHTRSFMADSGIAEELPEYVKRGEHHFPYANRLTGLEILPGGALGYWWPDPNQPYRKDQDIPRVVAESSLISGPQNPAGLDAPAVQGITHKIHLIRDARDLLVSLAHFAMKSDPRARHRRFERYFTAKDAFHGEWHRHAKFWARCASIWAARKREARPTDYFLRFEDMVGRKPDTVTALQGFLGFSPDSALTARILEETAVSSSRNYMPEHVRNGTPGDWHREFFTKESEAQFHLDTGWLLESLGYRDPSNVWPT